MNGFTFENIYANIKSLIFIKGKKKLSDCILSLLYYSFFKKIFILLTFINRTQIFYL